MAKKKNPSLRDRLTLNSKSKSRPKKAFKRGGMAQEKGGFLSKFKPRMSVKPVDTGISLDRKFEISGIIISLTGLLTFLSLLSGNQGSISGAWVSILSSIFGWGIYLLPILLIALGLWMILKNFERVPHFSLERVIGFLSLFLISLVMFHYFATPTSGREPAMATAQLGQGGGYIGAIFLSILEGGLGTAGLWVAVLAWSVIAFAMALDATVLDLFKWVNPLVLRVQDAWDDYQARRTQSDQNPSSDGFHAINPEQVPEPPAPIESQENPNVQVPQVTLGQAVGADGVTAPPIEWVLPTMDKMLNQSIEVSYNDDIDQQRAQVIEETLASFGAPAHVVEINRGPTITQFGVEPAFIESRSGRTRVRVSKISALADDLSLSLAASRIRIQAPVPGKGYVGIEVPNEQIAVVGLRAVVENKAFTRLSSPLRFGLGQDVAGHAVAADLTGLPHLLVAGATGSGKSVFVNALIACMLLHNTPEMLRMIMIDPKRVELTGYNGIPHLLVPVVTEIDRVVGVLQWVTREMDSRYQKFADLGARNIEDYNKRMESSDQTRLPFIVVMIDELADMMMIAPDQTEKLITRIAQLARATGIHMVISTQRPSVDVVTGLIKANFPARIAFAVASGTDSRVILDQPGAERLLGKGDMLFQSPDAPAPVRLQGVFVSEEELQRVVQYWRGFAGTTTMAPVAATTPIGSPPANVKLKQMPIWEEMEEEDDNRDALFDKAVAYVRQEEKASISMLQRHFRIGYTRAARLVDAMENAEIIGPATGSSSAREILDSGESLLIEEE